MVQVTTIGDLPSIKSLQEAMEKCKSGGVCIQFHDPEVLNNFKEYIDQFITVNEEDLITDNFQELLLNNERRYMLLEHIIEPLKRDPFWAQQGKYKKGKRGRY